MTWVPKPLWTQPCGQHRRSHLHGLSTKGVYVWSWPHPVEVVPPSQTQRRPHQWSRRGKELTLVKLGDLASGVLIQHIQDKSRIPLGVLPTVVPSEHEATAADWKNLDVQLICELASSTAWSVRDDVQSGLPWDTLFLSMQKSLDSLFAQQPIVDPAMLLPHPSESPVGGLPRLWPDWSAVPPQPLSKKLWLPWRLPSPNLEDSMMKLWPLHHGNGDGQHDQDISSATPTIAVDL